MFNALKVAVILSAVDNMSKVVKGAVDKSSLHLTRFSKETSKLGDKAFALGQQAGLFGLAVGAPLLMTIRAAEDAQAEIAKLEQGFKTMGDTTGKMAKKAQEFSSSLMMEIAIDDEQIMAVEGKLATFEKVIKNSAGTAEIFERSTRAAFDMQAAGFGDAMSNASQLGKALGDPLKGMQALRKSGTLMQADIDRIGKEYQKTGNLLKAQRQIMDAIEKQVQGKAAANAKATEKLKIAFGEVAEQIGGALLPEVQKFAKWIEKVLPKIQDWIKDNKHIVTGVAKLAAGLSILSLGVSAVAFVFGGLMKVVSFGSTILATITAAVGLFSGGISMVTTNFSALNTVMKGNIIILIATAIAGIALLIYANWDKITKFFSNLWSNVKSVFWKVVAWLKEWGFLFSWPVFLLIKYWDKIKGFFIDLWAGIKSLFWKVVAWLKEWGVFFLAPIGLIIKYWDKIVEFFSGLWTKIKNIFNSFIVYLGTLGDKMYNAGVNIVNNIWNGMKAKFKDMVDWFKGGLQEMRNMLPFSPAKTGPLKDIHKLKFMETMATSIKPAPMLNAMHKAMAVVKVAASPKGGGGGGNSPAMSVAGGGGSVVVNFSPTINMGATGGSKQDFLAQLKEYEPQLMRVIKEAMARQERKKFA